MKHKSSPKIYRRAISNFYLDEAELELIKNGPFETKDTTIRSAYFGKDKKSSGSGSELGLHLVINSNTPGAVWDADYTKARDIGGLLDDLSLGKYAWEKEGRTDINNLAGTPVTGYYVKLSRESVKNFDFLVGISAPKYS